MDEGQLTAEPCPDCRQQLRAVGVSEATQLVRERELATRCGCASALTGVADRHHPRPWALRPTGRAARDGATITALAGRRSA